MNVMSRDEIIDAMKGELFSIRRVFSSALSERCKRDGFNVAWPDAVFVLSVDDWRYAFDEAMRYKQAKHNSIRL
jgi:hypothetical protein